MICPACTDEMETQWVCENCGYRISFPEEKLQEKIKELEAKLIDAIQMLDIISRCDGGCSICREHAKAFIKIKPAEEDKP